MYYLNSVERQRTEHQLSTGSSHPLRKPAISARPTSETIPGRGCRLSGFYGGPRPTSAGRPHRFDGDKATAAALKNAARH